MDPNPSIPGREQQRLFSQELRAADAGAAAGSYAEYYAQEQAQVRRASLTGKNPSAKAAGVTLARLGAAAGLIIALMLPTVGNGQDGPPKASQTLWMRVTGYCRCSICCGRHAHGVTASGAPATGLLLAASWSWRFGTRMTVPGYGHAVVLDRGRLINTPTRLDCLFATHQQAKAWGCRWLPVEIVSRAEYRRRVESALFQLRFDELVAAGRRLTMTVPGGAR